MSPLKAEIPRIAKDIISFLFWHISRKTAIKFLLFCLYITSVFSHPLKKYCQDILFIISWCFCIFAKKNRQRIENYLRFIAKNLKTRLNFLLGFSPATKLFKIFSHFRATLKPNWIQFALYGDLMNCAIPDMRRNQDVVLHIFGAGTLSVYVYIFLFTRIKTSEKIILLVNPFQTKNIL